MKQFIIDEDTFNALLQHLLEQKMKDVLPLYSKLLQNVKEYVESDTEE